MTPRLLVVLVSAVLAGCATPPEIVPPPAGPPLVLERFFAGRTQGEGTFTNAFTGAERRFAVTIDGTWDGRTLVLVEDFVYADGERDRKTWRLEQTAPGTYVGRREDVVGQARAWTEDRTVRLVYTVELGGWTVDFSDVLALREDGSLLNRATVGKWGLRVGRVELVLRPAAQGATAGR